MPSGEKLRHISVQISAPDAEVQIYHGEVISTGRIPLDLTLTQAIMGILGALVTITAAFVTLLMP